LALGFIGAAWWLRLGLGSRYALCTVGVGLLCVTFALLVGDRLAEAILNLAATADTIRSGTILRTGPGTS
jgi:hypothetical protein